MDEAFGTLTLRLDDLPNGQGEQLLLALYQHGIDIDENLFFEVKEAVERRGYYDRSLLTIDVHLCPQHTVLILNEADIADIEREGEK
jgi:hypothetical protein